jgi:hypothetical protein
MSERQPHIDEPFIPEGLEFREEYMHAALGNYRRKKRAILWKKIGITAAILIAALTGASLLWNKSEKGIQAEEIRKGSAIEQQKISNDSLSTIDLENDKGTFNRNRQSPAVESVEATQDLSTKAVDVGDPMSSGVGLPGQLSTVSAKLRTKTNVSSTPESQSKTASEVMGVASENHNNNQAYHTESPENQASERSAIPVDLPYLPIESFSFEGQLLPNQPLPHLPINRWSLYATLGTKLWADYGFGSGPTELDPIVGVGVDFKWLKKMSFRLCGQFFTVSGVAAPYIATQRQYGEGFRETTYRYHTDRFYHGGLSAGATYRLNSQHSIGLFAESTALITADNRIETGQSSSYESSSSNTVEARGYVQGFRTVQHSLGVGYEYALGKNKSLGINYRHGLSDVTINSFFGNEMSRNSMLSFYFKLQLTR